MKHDYDYDSVPGNAEDETKTFDMYHVRSRWNLAFLVLMILALLLLLLYALLTGGDQAV